MSWLMPYCNSRTFWLAVVKDVELVQRFMWSCSECLLLIYVLLSVVSTNFNWQKCFLSTSQATQVLSYFDFFTVNVSPNVNQGRIQNFDQVGGAQNIIANSFPLSGILMNEFLCYCRFRCFLIQNFFVVDMFNACVL